MIPRAIASTMNASGTIQMLLRTYSVIRQRVRQDISTSGVGLHRSVIRASGVSRNMRLTSHQPVAGPLWHVA
jgi:hypothetical protein